MGNSQSPAATAPVTYIGTAPSEEEIDDEEEITFEQASDLLLQCVMDRFRHGTDTLDRPEWLTQEVTDKWEEKIQSLIDDSIQSNEVPDYDDSDDSSSYSDNSSSSSDNSSSSSDESSSYSSSSLELDIENYSDEESDSSDDVSEAVCKSRKRPSSWSSDEYESETKRSCSGLTDSEFDNFVWQHVLQK